MKANRTLITTLAIGGLLITLSPMLQAEDPATPANTPPAAHGQGAKGGRAMGPNIDKMAEDLKLTDDQKTKVKTVLDDQRTKMQDMMKDKDLSREDRRTKMQDIRKDTNAKMKDILTADQYAQWEKMGPGMRQRRNAHPADDNKAQQ